MAIETKKIKELQEKWGNKKCNHPRFEKEIHGMVTDCGYVEIKTGDYVCSQCGEVFTKDIKEQFEKKRFPQKYFEFED